MFHVICYDIVDDKRRNKVAAFLLDYGSRVQFSVFEVVKEDIKEIVEGLSSLIDSKKDSIICYHVCNGCRKKTVRLGREKRLNDVENTIII